MTAVSTLIGVVFGLAVLGWLSSRPDAPDGGSAVAKARRMIVHFFGWALIIGGFSGGILLIADALIADNVAYEQDPEFVVFGPFRPWCETICIDRAVDHLDSIEIKVVIASTKRSRVVARRDDLVDLVLLVLELLGQRGHMLPLALDSGRACPSLLAAGLPGLPDKTHPAVTTAK
jgi:hypothetical protein